ncbi:hypothetical protein [Croceicoccus sp. Ery5]|uniref:hypothetical protein n=1 Tax=Croceicoccus sp. Ery5 TaxID=1703340 RepID=UPI001E393FB2|nr:hypothetical protein [Croceicoccus sp. Ery5]
MAVFDQLLGQLSSETPDVANLATKLGIQPAMAEKAIAALGQAHQAPGDTVELASVRTGMDTSILSTIVEQIGGEGSLTHFAQMLKDNPQAAGILDMLDRDGDGNPLNDIMGMAQGFFGKK